MEIQELIFFQLYEKKFDRPNKLNLTDYTKIKTNNNENFDLFMIYYINKYFSNNNPPDLLFVDLASTKHFNIRNNIYLIMLSQNQKQIIILLNL